MLLNIFTTSLLLAASTSAAPTAEVDKRATNPYLANAHSAITKLQTFYNSPSPGFWSAGWWNSANCLTLLADLRAVDSSTFMTNLTDGANGVFQHTLSGQHLDANGALQYDDFFDDELWWVVALLQTHKTTGYSRYLKAAKASFDKVTIDNKPSYNPCGGLANAYQSEKYLVRSSTIATVLYVDAAAQLAMRYPSQKATYLNLATTQWQWLANNILINGIMQGDGLTGSPPSCGNNHAFLTYIEGVAMTALVSLYQATNNVTWLNTADTLASKVLSGKFGMMDSNQIVQEYCDPNLSCNPDTAQFKGIMMRGLFKVYKARSSAAGGAIPAFIKKNADSIWANTRGSGNLLGQKWAGPFALGNSQALQLSSHSSATMALVMAAML